VLELEGVYEVLLQVIQNGDEAEKTVPTVSIRYSLKSGLCRGVPANALTVYM